VKLSYYTHVDHENFASIGELRACIVMINFIIITATDTRKPCCRRESARCRCNFRSI